MKNRPSFDIEISFSEQYSIIAGVDEVGRGAIAGPIVSAAVVFSDYKKIAKKLGDIDDSKKLTDKTRREFDQLIRKTATDFAIGEATVAEIDSLGIGAANVLSFKRALDQLRKCDFVLIDGRKFRGFDRKYMCIEKGESKSISIAAASIIAKVYRDDLMLKLGEKIGIYDFCSNKGYGSDNHFKDLELYGISDYHRRSFLNCLNKDAQRLF